MIQELVDIQSKVENGEMKPHQAYGIIYQIESTLKQVKSAITDNLIKELQDYTKGDEPVVDGFRIVLSSRRTFKYDHDPTWERFKSSLQAREEMMKKAIGYAKKHNSPLVDEHGEEIPLAKVSETIFPKMEKA
jgi:GTPase SAR1 family protein